MRKIGNLPTETEARRFSAYLTSIGIANQADYARDLSWEIWVHNDAQLERAAAELEQFVSSPNDERYTAGARAAERKQREDQSAERRSRARIIDARSQWGVFHTQAMGLVTLVLIGICVVLFILERMGSRARILDLLMFSDLLGLQTGDYLSAIKHGQVWRVFTPVLLHGSILHILFNMMWLRQLGSTIEYHEGSFVFGLQVLVFGVLSNLLQVYMSGPLFLGMSGVVYGLFGYIWICAKHDPRRAYVLEKDTVIWMIAWFVLCFTGWIGPIANWAHAGGLLAGMIWGSITARQIPFTRIRW